MVVTRDLKIGQEKIVVPIDAGFEHLADWLLGVFLKMHQAGSLMADGKRVQLGWSTLVLRRQQDMTLLVYEPNFMNDPLTEEMPGATYTLKVQSAQVEFADRAKVTPLVTAFQEKIVIERGCLSSNKIYMSRVTPSRENNDSGWFIGAQKCVGIASDSEADVELDAIYAFELLRARPALLPTLILPSEFMVMVEGDGIVGVINANNETVMY